MLINPQRRNSNQEWIEAEDVAVEAGEVIGVVAGVVLTVEAEVVTVGVDEEEAVEDTVIMEEVGNKKCKNITKTSFPDIQTSGYIQEAPLRILPRGVIRIFDRWTY